MPPKKREIKSAIQFPINPKKGDRGTTYGNKAAWAAAVAKVDPKEGEKVNKEKDWRHKYPKYIVKQVQLGLQSPEKALAIAEAGLDYVYKNFEFIREGEQPMSLEAAMAKFTTHNFGTGVIQGTGKKPAHGAEVTIPYKPFGTKGPSEPLRGEKLRALLTRWSDYGTIEPSAKAAIEYLIDNPKALDLSDKYFVLLGASSAMGPYLTLLALGANIIALDIPVAGIWKDRLIAKARDSPGRIIFPTKNKTDIKGLSDDEIAKVAGCDLLNEAPEIRNWLLTVEPGKQLIVGGYAYLDGDLFVKLSLAMDAIIKDLTEKRKATPAYLCTPTDVHVISEEAHKAAKDNYSALSPVNLVLTFSPFQLVPGALTKNALKPIEADNGKDTFYIVDGIVNRQGPNYALAKRIQHWRAIVARTKTGVNVSSNIAPSTATVSVTSNWLFALAYRGWHFFKPLEVFNEDTSNAVMAAVLIHDVQNPNAPVQPKNKLRNPLELFTYGSLHGGIWRCGYKIDSVGEAAALLYLFTTPTGLLVLVSFLVVVVAVLVQFSPQLQALVETHVLPLLNQK